MDHAPTRQFRWDCEANGCFHKLKCPKFEVFHDCFPGRITFGDVDGICEINGHFLLMEWKSSQKIPMGQNILYEKFTKYKNHVVYVICGNAETMVVTAMQEFHKGKGRGWTDCDISYVKSRIKSWVEYARYGAEDG